MDERHRYITKISRNLDLYKRKNKEMDDFSSSEEMSLHLIRHNKGISQERLSKLLGLDKALITRIVKKLIDQGLVDRKRSQKDKRAYELYPTDKAESFKKDIVDLEDNYYRSVFSVFSDEEKEQFLSLLTKVYTKSKQIRKQGK